MVNKGEAFRSRRSTSATARRSLVCLSPSKEEAETWQLACTKDTVWPVDLEAIA